MHANVYEVSVMYIKVQQVYSMSGRVSVSQPQVLVLRVSLQEGQRYC